MDAHVVVIGGGYAGVMAARTAADHHARVTVVDADGMHDFLPRLATVAAGVGPREDAHAPLTELLHRIDVVAATVTAIAPAPQLVQLDDGRALSYDALVVAAGAQATPPAIPGLGAHGWTLRTADDALRLRDHLDAGVEALVIVGAGATGTQLAGEVTAARPGLDVVLAEMTDRILPSLPASMAARAHRLLADRGVDVRTGVRLDAVDADGATLSPAGATGPAGQRTDRRTTVPGMVVWTGGFRSDASAILPDAQVVDGRLVVDRATVVADHGPVLAAGDVAAHRGRGGRLLPQTAQVAVRAGSLAGANAVRLAEGRRARPGTLAHIGWVLPLGGGHAVAQVGPLVLADAVTARVAPLLHDAIDVRHLFTVGGLPAVVNHHQQPISLP